ncbi:hypothetical protein ACFW96_11265 [Streptomyces gardneri]|uniref:hypothetical protein n=1 Tax=Streptomyces gardneri TaxID=66892 RepID=UPI0036BEDADF
MPELLEGRRADPATWMRTPAENLVRLAALKCEADARRFAVADGPQCERGAAAASPARRRQQRHPRTRPGGVVPER